MQCTWAKEFKTEYDEGFKGWVVYAANSDGFLMTPTTHRWFFDTEAEAKEQVSLLQGHYHYCEYEGEPVQ